MTFLTRLFGAIDRTFLARSYVISFAILGLCITMTFQADGGLSPSSLPFYGFMVLNAALFPFAKLVWNELRDFLMGANFVIANAFLVFGLKMLINMMLWVFAVFVAPLGVAYLWFRTREA